MAEAGAGGQFRPEDGTSRSLDGWRPRRRRRFRRPHRPHAGWVGSEYL